MPQLFSTSPFSFGHCDYKVPKYFILLSILQIVNNSYNLQPSSAVLFSIKFVLLTVVFNWIAGDCGTAADKTVDSVLISSEHFLMKSLPNGRKIPVSIKNQVISYKMLC